MFCKRTDVINTQVDSSKSGEEHIKDNFGTQSYSEENIDVKHTIHKKADEAPTSVKKIIANWKYIKQNIDPMPLLDELHKRNMLSKNDFEDLGDKRRSHQTTLLLIAACKQIQVEDDFQKFKESIRTLSSKCAKQLDQTIQEPHFQSIKTSNEEIDLLQAHRRILEEKLYPDDFLSVLDDFIEKFVFDLNTVEKIIVDFPAKKANECFFGMIIRHLKNGSFSCLVENLQKVRNHRRFQHLTKATNPATEVYSEFYATSKLEIDLPSTDDLLQAIEENPDVNNDCKELLHRKIEKITSGSIVFHLSSAPGVDIPRTTCDAVECFLHKLFKNEKIQSRLLQHQGPVDWRFNDDNIIRNCDTCDMEQHDIIRANRSFLIKEINVATLITSFHEKKVKCFDQVGIDNIDRPEQANRFIDILQEQPRNVLDMFLEILKETNMTYVLNRLIQCTKVYKSYSAEIKDNIGHNALVISDDLEFAMIKDTFEERKIFPLNFFHTVEQQYEENEEQIQFTLKQILKKGPFAVMTLVDVLYINNFDSLAETLLSDSKIGKGKTRSNTPKETIPTAGWGSTETTQLKGTYLLDIRGDTSEDAFDMSVFQHRKHSRVHDRPSTLLSTQSSRSRKQTESGYGSENCTNRTSSIRTNSS